MSAMIPPSPRTRPRRAHRAGRPPRQSSALLILAAMLAVIAILVAIFTAAAIANPTFAAQFIAFQATPTLFVLNPSATLDPRHTLPATWTPTRTQLASDSPTPSRTPTITDTPTATTTRVPTMTFTPVNTEPVGWYEYVVREAKFAVQFPSTWTAVKLTDRDPSDALAEITQGNVVMLESIRDGLGQAVLDNLIMVAFDTATSSDPYVINMAVAYVDPAEGATIDEVRDLHLQLYEGTEFYEVTGTDRTRVDFQPAQRIRYTTDFSTEAGSTKVYHQEVIAEQRLSREPFLLITLSTSKERRNIYEALLDRIVTTIRYTR